MSENKFGPWVLSASESDRLERYRRQDDLMNARNLSEHDPLYALFIQKYRHRTERKPALWIGIPAKIARVKADMLLSAPRRGNPVPNLTSKDETVQQRLEALAERSDLYSVAYNAAYWMSGQGDVYLTVVDRRKAEVRTESGGGKLDPLIMFRRATGSVARNVRPVDGSRKSVLFRTQHSSDVNLYTEYSEGHIRHYAFKNNNGQDGAAVALPDGYEQDIAVAGNLAVHIASVNGDADTGLGKSDFEGVEDLVFEASEVLRQGRVIINRHSEPGMNVPLGTLDDTGTLDVETKKVFENGPNGDVAGYIQANTNMDGLFRKIEVVVEFILMASDTPKVLWKSDATGQAESGRALMFHLLPGLAATRRNGHVIGRGIEQAARLALQREDVISGRTPGEYADIRCMFDDKFIIDESEQNQAIQLLRSANALSLEEAVRMRGLVGEAAAAEVERLRAEAPQAPVGF